MAEIGIVIIEHLHPVHAGLERRAAAQIADRVTGLLDMKAQAFQGERVHVAQRVCREFRVEEMNLF